MDRPAATLPPTSPLSQANRRFSDARSLTVDDDFEVESVFRSGSKKQNLSHLLQFQFEPRGTSGRDLRRGERGRNGRNAAAAAYGARKRKDSYRRPKYNKEQYLQAK